MQKHLNSNSVRLRFVDRVADFNLTALLDPKVALLGQNIFCFPDVSQFNQALAIFISLLISWRLQFYFIS